MSSSGPDYLDAILSTMVYQVPFLLAYVIGIVIVFLRRRQCPRAASMALAALTLMFLNSFLGSALHGYLIAGMSYQSNASTAQIVSIVGLARGIVSLTGIGLLVCAVFTGRPRLRQPAD